MARKVGRVVAGGDAGSMSLREEIVGLRESLRQARAQMESGEEDMAKIGALVARLTDSIGRALLAQGKLAASADSSTWLRAETDRLLRELGLGEA